MRELFESTIERLLGDIATPEYIRAAESGAWSADLWSALEDNGILLAGAPEAAGGAEASWSELFVIARAAGRFAAPVPLVEMLLGNWLLEKAGIGARSGVLTVATDSCLQWNGGRISGELRQVPWGRHAELVIAMVGEGAESTVLLVEPAAAENIIQGTNIAGEPRDTLQFAAANVVASAPLPAGLSESVLLTGGAMLRSAQMAGALTALMELTSGYAADRKQFGRPIAAFQAIQQQLAVLAEQTAAANIAAEAAFVESTDHLAAFSIAAAKVSTAEAASLGAGIGHSVHGAIGFTQEYTLHLLTRRLWAWRGEYGSSTFWSKLLGAHICAAGAQNFWPAITHAQQQELIVPPQGSHL
ncbi:MULTISPECIES: acyl-CoA dehydrogenase family protein [Pseudomonas]|uniref:acyl-CoA dehydrogenase family protein n=1 Tax=Pseudomonas TaxID=286 RepID=UPI001238AA6C|nr:MULTISPECIES: acyl-CoA dehydrogenase family protein [Pseudomonas]QIB51510.1 acyl-CoA dehydrogenase [Pseudomonas sp. OIL-1]